MVGILTFQDTTNYGAVLQAVALQRKIASLGFSSEIVRYHCGRIYENEHPQKISRQRSLHGVIRCMVTNRAMKSRVRKFGEFTRKYLRVSEREYEKRNIAESNPLYDRFIVGSDQVWNVELTGRDYTYFLDFVSENGKKGSYAASFGYEKIHGDAEKQKKLLGEFADLNVREQQGRRIIRELTGREANVVLDPTLLLKASEWDELASPRLYTGDYVFVYLIDRSKANFGRIGRFAKEHGCKVVYLHNYIKSHPGFINIRDASPQDFLSYVKYAKYVFTGSFHCVCFSLLYRKEMFYTLAQTGRNSRLKDLLNLVHMENRLLSDGKIADEAPADFSLVDAVLKEQKRFSERRLKSMLNRREAGTCGGGRG